MPAMKKKVVEVLMTGEMRDSVSAQGCPQDSCISVDVGALLLTFMCSILATSNPGLLPGRPSPGLRSHLSFLFLITSWDHILGSHLDPPRGLQDGSRR